MKFRLPFLPLIIALCSQAEITASDPVRPAFLPEKLEDFQGKKMDSAELSGKYIGLYFSASWCSPCRAFTPRLKEFRNRHLEDGFEVVLVNFDRTNTEKRRYVRDSGMEWPSVPGARRKPSKSLAEAYDVETYPALVVLDPEGRIVTSDGVKDVTNDPERIFDYWKKSLSPDA